MTAHSKPHAHHSQTSKAWRTRRQSCSRNECGHLPIEENDGCVDKCVSPICYNEVYVSDPLERGEIDRRRRNEFNGCLKRHDAHRFHSNAVNNDKGGQADRHESGGAGQDEQDAQDMADEMASEEHGHGHYEARR
ncbi:unnamed protein product [Vitrella brassicaformis CCMP3155]|uniref:Uncharacterized protein n=2 Tax=Vitrella brassicaformis TaxID=1169539 RepID=A0A0G4FSH9_VITBC|nr:unnamed protein product [Vitrella brassicaformis CCMP3155]|eukprot:CEM17383.1 unnamed protein product [Vitrella brassicaformis CCMP3155]